MLTKESKIKVLENFYALDYVFFGKHVAKMESCCPILKEEYLSVKGALISVYVEMLKMIDHSPETIKEHINSAALMKRAKYSATLARENAQKIVSTNKAKANIKESLKEAVKENKDTDLSKLVEHEIRMKAFGLAVDNLLLASTLNESKNIEALNEWSGRIMEDSYKILRDSLIECAGAILEAAEEEEDMEDEKEEEMKESDLYRKFDPELAEAIQEDVKHILSLGDIVDLNEAMTDREKTFLFGRIQRVFGDCAKKCGRIAVTSQQRACKDNCIAKRDAAIKAARQKVKAAKAQAKSDVAKAKGKIHKSQKLQQKAAKHSQTAKDIASY